MDQTLDAIVPFGEVQTHRIAPRTKAVVVARDAWAHMSAAITSVGHHAGPDLAAGAVVGVPDHTTMAVVGIRSRGNVGDVPRFAALTAELHDRAAMPCSPDLYWSTGTDLLRLDSRQLRAGAGPALLAPDSVRGELDRLPA